MIEFIPHTPMHVREGSASSWRRWFAWRPVHTERDGWIWLRFTFRRRFYPPIWFCPPAPFNGWFEYSDDKLGFWERRVSTIPQMLARDGDHK